MLVPFDTLPDNARIWIYPASRAFTAEEKKIVTEQLSTFLTQWSAHGQSLTAGFDLPYNQFIVIGLDEQSQAATGCSIDASVHLIQSIEQLLEIHLLDKMNVCYRQDNQLHYTDLKAFRKLAKTPTISPKTIVFNNLVVNKAEYKANWEVPAHASWHSRFIK